MCWRAISAVMLMLLNIACIMMGVSREPVCIYASENAAAIAASGAITGICRCMNANSSDTRMMATIGLLCFMKSGSSMPRKQSSSTTGAIITARNIRYALSHNGVAADVNMDAISCCSSGM